MFSTDDIIELEKKWLKYKIKQKSKLYIFLFLIILVASFTSYKILLQKKVVVPIEISKTEMKQIIKPIKKEIPTKKVSTTVSKLQESNSTIIVIENNTTKEKIKVDKAIETIQKEEKTKPYHFKLEQTEQGSELFSSNGFLVYNSPFEKKVPKNIEKEKVVEAIRTIQKENKPIIKEVKKPKISIDMKEMDTIAYLKEKFYSTSSIVFALMLSEEYYYSSDYKNSLKWALTANDIDAQNTKTWYWFAKSKVKLNQKKDATKALKAYLANNESKRLRTLLQKIEHGDTDD